MSEPTTRLEVSLTWQQECPLLFDENKTMVFLCSLQSSKLLLPKGARWNDIAIARQLQGRRHAHHEHPCLAAVTSVS